MSHAINKMPHTINKVLQSRYGEILLHMVVKINQNIVYRIPMLAVLFFCSFEILRFTSPFVKWASHIDGTIEVITIKVIGNQRPC